MADPDAEKGDTTASTGNFAKFLMKSRGNLVEILRLPPCRLIDSGVLSRRVLFKAARQIYYLPS